MTDCDVVGWIMEFSGEVSPFEQVVTFQARVYCFLCISPCYLFFYFFTYLYSNNSDYI